MNGQPIYNKYKGFSFRISPDPFMIMIDGKDLIHFDLLPEVHKFCDQVTDGYEARLGDMKLHLTGCKRCQRTMAGIKLDPCELGKSYIMNARALAQQYAKAAAEAIEDGRKENVHSVEGETAESSSVV